ncbi:MAG: GNAT family N-acetyltransferase [Herminiimonas sp.]|nr:GNAT family N-acetyltransferase [Herminiimonas sp.]
MLALRQEVFVVEQECVFSDIDWHDQGACHLLAWQLHGGARILAGYLRILAPGVKFVECAIGRVVSAPTLRGTGVGRQLVATGLHHAQRLYPGRPMRIGAQLHLVDFYAGFGFRTASAPYDEDHIMHVEMLRDGQT